MNQRREPSAHEPSAHEPSALEISVARLIAKLRAGRNGGGGEIDARAVEAMSAPAFRALVAERLRALERDVAEVRTRVNGLLFVVAGAVVSQLLLRLLG